MIKFINKTICMLFTMILVACSIRPGLQDPLIYPQATDISLGTFHPVTGIKEEKIVSFQTSDLYTRCHHPMELLACLDRERP